MLRLDRFLALFLFLLGSITAHREISASSASSFPKNMLISNTSSLEWCIGSADYSKKGTETYESSVDLCKTTFEGAGLPSVNSWEDNQALYVQFLKNILIGSTPLGLQCEEDGKWHWQNGEPFGAYTNFEIGEDIDPKSCDYTAWKRAKPIYYMNLDGRWQKRTIRKRTSRRHIICTKRPSGFDPTAVPAYTQLASPCETGWTHLSGSLDPSTGLCYYTDSAKTSWSWEEASEACAKKEATLPTILNVAQNSQVAFETMRSWKFDKDAQFWIGLVCRDDGEFVWQDGTAYTDFGALGGDGDHNCTSDSGYYYSESAITDADVAHFWNSGAKTDPAVLLVCSKYPSVSDSTTQIIAKTTSAVEEKTVSNTAKLVETTPATTTITTTKTLPSPTTSSLPKTSSRATDSPPASDSTTPKITPTTPAAVEDKTMSSTAKVAETTAARSGDSTSTEPLTSPSTSAPQQTTSSGTESASVWIIVATTCLIFGL